MSPFAQQALDAARGYLRSHPEEIGKALRSALGLRASVPFVAVRWLAQQAEKGGTVKLLRPSGKVEDLLQLTKLWEVFEIFDEEKQALASF